MASIKQTNKQTTVQQQTNKKQANKQKNTPLPTNKPHLSYICDREHPDGQWLQHVYTQVPRSSVILLRLFWDKGIMKKKQDEKKCLPQNKPYGQYQQDFAELQPHRFHFSERKSENKM